MTSTSERAKHRFATTRWSMVMRHAAGEAANARGALGELAGRYWYPVYIYIRRCGHAPEAATRLARRFLQQLLHELSGAAEPSHGHYRSYLLSRLHKFLAGDHSGGDEGDLQVPPDLEARYRADQLESLSPEQSYQRGFALQVLHQTMRRLRSEAQQTGHLPMYEQLEPFLGRDPVPGEYELIAKRLQGRPLTVVVALKRLRQRFRELAADELVDTVASAADLASEQDALFAVLSAAHP